MHFEVETISEVKRKVIVDVPAEMVDSEIKAAYGRLKNQVKMDGFRKGKIPMQILERHYKGHVEEDVTTKIINDSFNRIMNEKNLFPVSEPEVEASLVVGGSPFKFSATFEVRPEVDVKGYEGIRVERPKGGISDLMVEERLDAIRKRNTTLHEVSRSLNSEDTAIIDFEGFIDEVPFQGGKGEGVPLKIGSGRFIPGFEEQLVGMSVGDDREVKVKFPADYHAKEFAGKDALFKVKLKGVKEEILPALDDDFAKDLGFEDLGKLKAEIRTGMEREEEKKVRDKMKEQILDAVAEKNSFEVPHSMIGKQTEYLLSELKGRYERAGLSADNELAKEGSIEKVENTAKKQVKNAIILAAISKKEGIAVSEGDVDARLAAIATDSKVDINSLRAYYMKNKLMDAVRREVLDEKVFDLLISRASVVEV